MAGLHLPRPEGYILGSEQFFSNVVQTTNAEFVASSHGLVDLDVIFIKSEFEDYNGFWTVNRISSSRFQVYRYGVFPQCYKLTGVTQVGSFYKCTKHNWSAVHLPIIYSLYSNLWPVNSVDTVRTVSSLTDSNGYCNITASGDIKATGSAAKLEYVKISGATDSSLDGVYQIISYSSDTSFVIDLAYSSATDTAVTGASIQFYYNNYCIKVKIYAGIPAGHTYDDIRPTALIAEKKIIPDDNGEAFFSIHDLLQQQLELRNGRLLRTLPNNIDFWTSFYITYADSYDDSDGSTLSTYTSSYTDDSANFVGYATQSKLEFKNRHSGSMSDYITRSSSAKFLTLFSTPVLFPGNTFDISFIIEDNSDISIITLRQQYYRSGVLQATTNISVPNTGPGIYRQTLTDVTGNYDQVVVTLLLTEFYGAATQCSEAKTITIDSECANQEIYIQWLNHLGGFDSWLFTAQKDHNTDIVDSGTVKKNIFPTWPNSYGEFADTIERQTFRTSRTTKTVRSQLLTQDQLAAITEIKKSPLVQLVNSIYDRRTVLIDTDSFKEYTDGDKLYTIEFKATYTDENPSQSI